MLGISLRLSYLLCFIPPKIRPIMTPPIHIPTSAPKSAIQFNYNCKFVELSLIFSGMY